MVDLLEKIAFAFAAGPVCFRVIADLQSERNNGTGNFTGELPNFLPVRTIKPVSHAQKCGEFADNFAVSIGQFGKWFVF